MLAYLNGLFLPQEQAVVSISDRGFMYGDGLFETILVMNSSPFRWAQHFERLARGAEFLRLKLPFSSEELLASSLELIRRNHTSAGLIRLTVSRGSGQRGYSVSGPSRPVAVMTLHPALARDPNLPPQWRLATTSIRVPARQLLTQFKTCNKLPQIIARAEASEAGADEALILNTEGFVIEGASSNLFWLRGRALCSPPVESGILPGVTRAVLHEICPELGLEWREENVRAEELANTEGVLLSLTSIGLAEATEKDEQPLPRSAAVPHLWRAFWTLVKEETASGSHR